MRRFLLYTVVAGLTLAIFSQWPQSSSAAIERQIESDMARRNFPAVITKITLGNSVVQAGRFMRPEGTPPDQITPFDADADWIKNLTIFLLNRTDYPIVESTVTIGFPQTGDGFHQPMTSYLISLGRIPDNANFDGHGKEMLQTRPPLNWLPGEILPIQLGDYIEGMDAWVGQKIPLSQVTKLRVTLHDFVLSNGTRWGGTYSTPDKAAGKWHQKEDLDFFPGNDSKYWPGRPAWIFGDNRL